MKRAILTAAVVLLACSTLYAAFTNPASNINYRNINWQKDGGTLDLWLHEVEGYLDGTSPPGALYILESTGATYYTKLQGGNQSANLTLTLPTAYAATTGYVLSSTDAGVLSWVANGTGTFTGGSITSDVTLSNGVDIMSSTTTAESASIKVYDLTAVASYTNVLSWTNGTVPDIAMGSDTSTFALNSTTIDIAAGAVSGVTSLAMGGALSGVTDLTAAGTVSINDSATTNTTSIGAGTTTGTITVGGTGTQAVNVGNGAGIKTVALGSNTTTSTTTILSGTTSGALSLNASAGGAVTNIGTGTSTGAINIGTGDTAQAVSMASGAGAKTVIVGSTNTTSTTTINSGSNGVLLNVNNNQPTNINTGTSTGAVTIGANGGTVAVNSSDWDISTGGNMTNIGAITMDGLLTGTLGATVSGATISLNDSSNFGVSINGGTATGTTTTIGGTGIQTINIGQAGTGAKTIAIGDGASTGSITIYSGTGDVILKSTDDILIGQDSVQQHITIGNETGDTALNFKAGTGNIDMQGVAATTITIGDAAQEGTMKFGESSATMELDIGTGTGAHTVHIADGAGAQIVTVGSVNTSAGTTIQSGTGDISITSTDDWTATASGAVALFSNAVEQTITLGNETGASSLNLKAGTGNINVQGVAATTITIGDAAQEGTISMGTSTAGLTMNLATGNGAKVVNVATGTGIDQIVLGGGGTAADNIDIADEDTQANTIDIGGTASTTTITGTVTNTAGYTKSAVNVGAVVGGTCTAAEYSDNGFHRTVLTLLTGTTVAISDSGDGTGIKIYDFPEGNVIILGAFADVLVTSDAGMTGAYTAGIGTVTAAADDSLTGTEVDFVASSAVTQGTNQNFHGASALTGAGLIMIPFDGTGGGKDVYFNAAAADASVGVAGANVTAQSGTVVIEWIYLGDF